MDNEFRSSEIELKKNIDVLDSSFEKYGLELLGTAVEYGYIWNVPCIRFYCEIISNENLPKNKYLYIKVNVYDEEKNLISMDNSGILTEEFSGYDTKMICVSNDRIHNDAVSVRVYVAE